LVFHGLGASKEVQVPELRQIASAGFTAVVLDNVGHGARRYPDFEARFSSERADQSYFEAVAATAAEVRGLKEAIAEEGWAGVGRIGALSISMGAAVVFGGIASGAPLAAAVTIVGTPVWRHQSFSPHQRLDAFFPTPLLCINCERDETVSPGDARELCRSLGPRYSGAPERLEFIELPGERHIMSGQGWSFTMDRALAWFQRFLGSVAGMDTFVVN
jgi:dienelactone hydrolase